MLREANRYEKIVMRGYLCVLALCVGAVAGTVALKAQGTPPAYVMVQIEVTGNADTLRENMAQKSHRRSNHSVVAFWLAVGEWSR
jgi:hypothetical protein